MYVRRPSGWIRREPTLHQTPRSVSPETWCVRAPLAGPAHRTCRRCSFTVLPADDRLSITAAYRSQPLTADWGGHRRIRLDVRHREDSYGKGHPRDVPYRSAYAGEQSRGRSGFHRKHGVRAVRRSVGRSDHVDRFHHLRHFSPSTTPRSVRGSGVEVGTRRSAVPVGRPYLSIGHAYRAVTPIDRPRPATGRSSGTRSDRHRRPLRRPARRISPETRCPSPAPRFDTALVGGTDPPDSRRLRLTPTRSRSTRAGRRTVGGDRGRGRGCGGPSGRTPPPEALAWANGRVAEGSSAGRTGRSTSSGRPVEPTRSE